MMAMMFWYGGHWAVWQMGLMWAGLLVFLGLAIWAVYALATAATRRPSARDDGRRSGREILDRRLARGDIDEAEYLRLRDLISSGDQQEAGKSTARPGR